MKVEFFGAGGERSWQLAAAFVVFSSSSAAELGFIEMAGFYFSHLFQ